MPNEDDFDVLILGAGPAGAAAALFAAGEDLTVAVIEQLASTPDAIHPEWLHADARKRLIEAGIASDEGILGKIDGVEFVDPSGDRHAAAKLDDSIEVVDTARLTNAMLAAAADKGATVSMGIEAAGIEAREDAVSLSITGDRRIEGKLLLAADGCDSLSFASLGHDAPTPPDLETSCCQVVLNRAASPKSAGATRGNKLTWIVSADDLSSYGYVFEVGQLAVIGFVTVAPLREIPAHFVRALAQWKNTGLVPNGVNIDPARAEIRRVPRAVALEMETHVAKHCILIGDAGGFVSAVCHEGLYPAIWSARLAVDVCREALGSSHPQDVLAEFDARWRREMVEYLRLPNADLRFLVPLIFSNERMAHRFANALLSGQNI